MSGESGAWLNFMLRVIRWVLVWDISVQRRGNEGRTGGRTARFVVVVEGGYERRAEMGAKSREEQRFKIWHRERTTPSVGCSS